MACRRGGVLRSPPPLPLASQVNTQQHVFYHACVLCGSGRRPLLTHNLALLDPASQRLPSTGYSLQVSGKQPLRRNHTARTIEYDRAIRMLGQPNGARLGAALHVKEVTCAATAFPETSRVSAPSRELRPCLLAQARTLLTYGRLRHELASCPCHTPPLDDFVVDRVMRTPPCLARCRQ